MCAENFHALAIFKNIKPQDYIDYLLCQSAASKITKPQFHAVIDSFSEKKDKWELTQIAKEWLKNMGYGQQPYLIFFHKDTSINHIHIVSTRVERTGRAIKNSFEAIKAFDQLNAVLGIDAKSLAKRDLDHALSYKFSTRMEIIMLLFSMNYNCKLNNNNLILIRNGRIQIALPLQKLYARISNVQILPDRLQQLRDLFSKSIMHYDPSIRKSNHFRFSKFSSQPIKCTSDLITYLHKIHGLQLVFHSRHRVLPTDYCIIDHRNKIIYDGKQIMDIGEFIRPVRNSPSDNMLENKEITPDLNLIKHEELPIGAILISNFNIEISDDIDDKALFGRKRTVKKKTSTN